MIGGQRRHQGRGGAMQHAGRWFLPQHNGKPLTVADKDNIRKSSTLAPVISRSRSTGGKFPWHGKYAFRSWPIWIAKQGAVSSGSRRVLEQLQGANSHALCVSWHYACYYDSRSLALLTGSAGKFIELDKKIS